jgi:hypothetical protein
MSTLLDTQHNSERIATRKLWWLALVAGAVAFIGNLVVFILAENLFGVSLMIPATPGSDALAPLSLAPLAGASFVPAIAAAIVLALLGRFLARPIRVFQILAAVLLLVSFGAPLGLPVDGAAKVVLIVMHVVTAGAIVGLLTRLGPEK